MDAITQVPKPVNEPVHFYAPGTPERDSLKQELDFLAGEPVDVFPVIGGNWTANPAALVHEVRMPSDHSTLLARVRQASATDAAAAIGAAQEAKADWAATPFDERAAVFLRAAELLAGPRRDLINAATMLGQAKTVQQAEIDSACELIDFLRFNVAFARELYANQPISSPGSGTGWTTGRWTASSMRSPRSTSPPSPATCRRLRR